MEGERAVAVDEHEREDGRAQAEHDGARHGRRVERLGVLQQRQQPHHGQHDDDGAPHREVPARSMWTSGYKGFWLGFGVEIFGFQGRRMHGQQPHTALTGVA